MTDTKYHPRYQGQSRSFDYTAANCLSIAAVTASTPSTLVIPEGEYLLVASTACWITEAATPVAAAAAAGSRYIPANVPMLVQFNGATKLAAIRVAADGHVSLCKTD